MSEGQVLKAAPSILWFRQDLRLSDNPALDAAIKRGGPVIPVFIWAPGEEGRWPAGAASRWWLHQSLKSLDKSLRDFDSRLIFRKGPSISALEEIIKETGATALFWNRRYEPSIISRDQKIKEGFKSAGIVAESFNGSLLHEPWEVKNKAGNPFQVFTPFWKHCLNLNDSSSPLPRTKSLAVSEHWPWSFQLDELQLEPEIDWAQGMRDAWIPGETGAAAQVDTFLQKGVMDYSGTRNLPGRPGTSRLSPHLHFGEISPRQIWQEAKKFAERNAIAEKTWQGWQFLTELGWREFSHHLLYHFPQMPERPLRPDFERFPWHLDESRLRAWTKGQTGYPLVDAGMRELWAKGWMHNRVRMVVGSFLVKHLLISWTEGARWFWDTLVDADLAQNTLGWQWIAGCGADAAPYFRIFNPVSQGEKFDPQGDYVRCWVPELRGIPDVWIHQPWNAPEEILEHAGVTFGKNYPKPIVDHAKARAAALSAFAQLKQNI